MAEIHGTLGCLSVNGGKDVDDLRELHTRGLSYKVATEFDGRTPTKWDEKELGDPHEALRVKIIEMLGSEGPQTGDFSASAYRSLEIWLIESFWNLETRNVLSVGFYKQTDDAEYILKIDEHRLIDGSEDVVEYRWVQNLVLDKTFRQYEDGFAAFDSHVLFQKQQELLYRVNDFRFKDWQDMQLDSDVIMGRLLHNRMGYTTKETIPMLLGLKPEPWIGPMEEELLREESQLVKT